MLKKLNKQLSGEHWSWNNLNTLCWAIISISGSMMEEQYQPAASTGAPPQQPLLADEIRTLWIEVPPQWMDESYYHIPLQYQQDPPAASTGAPPQQPLLADESRPLLIRDPLQWMDESYISQVLYHTVEEPNPAYMSNSLPVVAVNVGQAGSEISSFSSNSSLPTKVVQYSNLVSVQSGTVPQYSRPILPHAGTRQLPLRFTDQHHPVQSAPAFVHPNSQTVTVGRLGQLVYVQPVTQDATPGTTVFSQGIPNQMLSPYHANIPKLQGATIQPLQLCMTPPIMAGASQPFLAPTHVPFPQPFPAIRPILVPGGNGFPACKFQ